MTRPRCPVCGRFVRCGSCGCAAEQLDMLWIAEMRARIDKRVIAMRLGRWVDPMLRTKEG